MGDLTFRLQVTFGKTGRLRYLSHLEIVRACERAVRRAGLEYAVTQGFSPHMRIAFGPALPVGTAGLAERYDVWVRRFVPPATALAMLVQASPRELAPLEVHYVPEAAPSLGAGLVFADYEVVVEGPDLDPESVRAGVDGLMAGGTFEIEHKGKHKAYDLAVCLPKEPEVREVPLGERRYG